MSHDRKDDRFPVDPLVRDAYRRTARGEEPSAKLDATILAAAAHRRPRRLHGLLPPLAMAATVVLALGLVLRLAAPPRDPLTVVEPDLERAITPSALEESAPGRASSATSEMIVEGVPSPAAAPIATVAPEPTSDVPAAERRLERFSLPATAVAPQAQQRAAPAPSISDAALGSAAAVQASVCDADERDAWITCIEQLIDAGRVGEAAAEVDALRNAYPDVAIPSSIADALQR